MDFNEFKKKMNGLKQGVEKMKQNDNTGYASNDSRIYIPKTDKSGNAIVLMRFLPQKDPSLSPIAITFTHSFQVNGRWIIETCPKSKDWNESCPICELSSDIYGSDHPLAKTAYKKRERWVNVYIKNDKNTPENNGKVFIWKMPVYAYNAINSKISPDIEEEKPIMIFDFFEGLDFKMKIKQKGGYNNYEMSEFVNTIAPIEDSEEKMKEIYNKIYDLEKFKQEKISTIKSYDKLKKILDGALNIKTTSSTNNPEIQGDKNTPEKSENTTLEDDLDDLDDIEFTEDGDDIPF